MMFDWLYRWMYRDEIRERHERMSAAAEVWRQRQVENDARWERSVAKSRALQESIAQAKTLDEVEALLDQWRSEWCR